MGSITDLFTDAINFFVGLVETGSTAADGFLAAGSTAADDVFGAVTGSIIGE